MSKLLMKSGMVAVLLAVSASAWAYPGAPIGLGQRVYNVTREAYATIVGVEMNGTFVLRFETGSAAGLTGGGWSSSDLASLSGCSGDLCVGQAAYNVPREASVQIVGIQNNGGFVLSFTSGSANGLTGSGWQRSDIAVERGCTPSGSFCVGVPAYNVTRSAAVTVVAIQLDGNMVLRFDTGSSAGLTGSGWSESDLAVTTPGYAPAPPVYVPAPPVYVPAPPVYQPTPPVVVVPTERTVVCSTQSNGRSFSVPGRGYEQTRFKVILLCQQNPFTNKSSCAQAAVCQ